MRFLPVARHSRRLSGAKLEAALWVVNIDDFPRSSRNPHFIGFFSPGLPLSATRLDTRCCRSVRAITLRAMRA
jgi:hypothetical protein